MCEMSNSLLGMSDAAPTVGLSQRWMLLWTCRMLTSITTPLGMSTPSTVMGDMMSRLIAGTGVYTRIVSRINRGRYWKLPRSSLSHRDID